MSWKSLNSALIVELLAHRAVFVCSLRSLRFALGSRLVRRRSQRKERLCSFLLTTAARETNTHSS
jgi:hypothetical protein